jgi:SsrA-binding protein
MEILNRKARYDYAIESAVETGIVLTGTEIKSIRAGHVNIRDTYGIIKNGECFLLNLHIGAYKEGSTFNHDETRTRKLLLHKKEIIKLDNKIKLEGYTLVPIKLYFKKGRVKIELGLAKGKKDYDKREAIKKRDSDREMKKQMKSY